MSPLLVVTHLRIRPPVRRIVFEQIGQVVGRNQVVDADELDRLVLDAGPENESADATKTIDAHANCHVLRLLFDGPAGPVGVKRGQKVPAVCARSVFALTRCGDPVSKTGNDRVRRGGGQERPCRQPASQDPWLDPIELSGASGGILPGSKGRGLTPARSFPGRPFARAGCTFRPQWILRPGVERHGMWRLRQRQ